MLTVNLAITKGHTTMISSSTSLGLPLVASLTGSVEPWTRIFRLYRATVTTVQPTSWAISLCGILSSRSASMRFLWKCGSVGGIESISRPFTASNACIQYPCDEVAKLVSELGKMRGRKNGLERSPEVEAARNETCDR